MREFHAETKAKENGWSLVAPVAMVSGVISNPFVLPLR